MGMHIRWHGKGADEIGVDAKTGRVIVKIDRHYFRPAEVDTLLGDASKAFEKLGWRAEISFDSLVSEMVEGDLKIAQRDAAMLRQGLVDTQVRIAM
jgi:GDPmannose 4,6-dehydratase